jgi:hypothetical protein
VNVSLDGVANDGTLTLLSLYGGSSVPAERDNVWGDVEAVWGTQYNDVIRGNEKAGVIFGLNGNDQLYGEAGDDALFGGAGNDSLYGGTGVDGLFGGIGAGDRLEGGADSDRFLDELRYQPLSFGAATVNLPVWSDNAVDVTAEDARIGFVNSAQSTTTSFGGQSGSYTYAPGTFSDAEIEAVDAGLSALHRATRNNNLLQTPDDRMITFTRYGAMTASNGGSFTAGAWNSGNGSIVLLNGTFRGDYRATANTVMHEIGHNWYEGYNASSWRAQSGWLQWFNLYGMNPGSNYIQGGDASGTWYYLKDAQYNFVSEYAKTNPNEDFAESFARFFTDREGWTTAGAAAGKMRFMQDMLNWQISRG